MGKLDGKVAVITGTTSGIGLASAKRFVQEGARVFMTGRRQADLDRAVSEVGHNARGVQGDVANMLDLDRLYDTVRQEAGRIDVLFANAGGGEFAALPDVTEAHFDRTFATNVKGTLFTVQKALPLLRDGASVILTGSTNGTKGGASFSVYSASKAAIRNFARSWVLDLASRHIRVNVLMPGATSTPGLHGLSSSEDADRTLVSLMESQIPLGRIGKPEETAAAALFLASDDSSFVNGSELLSMGDRRRSRSNAQVSANQVGSYWNWQINRREVRCVTMRRSSVNFTLSRKETSRTWRRLSPPSPAMGT